MIQQLVLLIVASAYARTEGCNHAIQALRDMHYYGRLPWFTNCCNWHGVIKFNEDKTQITELYL
jgi:hypothetical protein